jgi:Beta-glucosidase/6-phospho-beta-glucosidase/beta-galactosidase
MKKFEKGFLLGAATAAHQVEGNNIHSDFWALENAPHSMFKEPSGVSVDHYNRYKEDIDLLAAADLNAYRFSIEWARIQPTANSFDEAEIAHYRQMLEYCHSKGVEPIVTMHHFTSPQWLLDAGGWEAESTADAFAVYCAYVVSKLGHLMHYVCTINEANMGLQLTKIIRDMMRRMGDVQVGMNMDAMKATNPQKHFLSGRTPEGDLVIAHAHEKARDAMKAIRPELQIGITLSLHDFQPQPGGEEIAHAEQDEEFLHYLPFLQKDDFIGVQNYSRKIVGPEGTLPPPEGAELTQMNYEYYPEAVSNVVRFVAEHWKKPIMITENGVSTPDDTRRVEFLKRALEGVQACIADGLDVRGYMCWTLLDNFEWQLGFTPKFGLIAVDRETQKRTPKESLAFLGGYAPQM